MTIIDCNICNATITCLLTSLPCSTWGQVHSRWWCIYLVQWPSPSADYIAILHIINVQKYSILCLLHLLFILLYCWICNDMHACFLGHNNFFCNIVQCGTFVLCNIIYCLIRHKNNFVTMCTFKLPHYCYVVEIRNVFQSTYISVVLQLAYK